MTKSVTKSALSLITFGAVLALLQGTPAQALNTKSYVSNTGSDANDCSSVALACAGLQHAHDQTSPGGEVSVVSPGDYSGLNSSVAARLIIQKSIHITNDGVGEASIRTPGLNLGIAILIQPPLGAIVSVRGLVIDGVGVGLIGIDIMTPSAVHIQNCVVRNFQSFRGWGVTLLHGINTQLFISDSIIFNNGSDAFSGGIQIAPVNIPNISGSSDAKVVLDRVHLENNVIGVLVDGQISREGQQGVTKSAYVIIRDSVVSGNASDGIRAITTAVNSPAFLFVERTTVVNNAVTGILANGPGATMLLNDNTVTRNGVGISAINSGQLISFGNNRNANNVGPEGAPTGFFSQM